MKKDEKRPIFQVEDDLIFDGEVTPDTCGNCGADCQDICRFCMECGAENPGFNEGGFIKEWQMTLSDMQKGECDSGHPILTNIREALRPKFCFFCGKKMPAQ